ncbi:MAG: hypothetical protein P1V97_38115, partial [Planctomycetota bacterium]|nr:hypothetical protein [Planctomycetota bacterium]
MTMILEKNTTPEQLADNAIRKILNTQFRGEPLVRLDSPPGAGKTGVVERLAVQSMAIQKERCMIVTQTNQQCFDVTRRLTQGFPRLSFTLFVSAKLEIPDEIRQKGNLRLVTKTEDLPNEPCIVIANAKKWAWLSGSFLPFDLQIIDEAFQLHDAGFHLIANLARRAVLIGDPGQIDPVVTCEVERWISNPSGPHRPCPKSVCARHPGIRRMSLPISRRLVEDTVSFIQPAFYPDLPFKALAKAEDRQLEIESREAVDGIDQAMEKVASGASLVQLELAEKITGEADSELADAIVKTIRRLLERGAHVIEQGNRRKLEPSMIGVACAHVTQV